MSDVAHIVPGVLLTVPCHMHCATDAAASPGVSPTFGDTHQQKKHMCSVDTALPMM